MNETSGFSLIIKEVKIYISYTTINDQLNKMKIRKVAKKKVRI